MPKGFFLISFSFNYFIGSNFFIVTGLLNVLVWPILTFGLLLSFALSGVPVSMTSVLPVPVLVLGVSHWFSSSFPDYSLSSHLETSSAFLIVNFPCLGKYNVYK